MTRDLICQDCGVPCTGDTRRRVCGVLVPVCADHEGCAARRAQLRTARMIEAGRLVATDRWERERAGKCLACAHEDVKELAKRAIRRVG